MKPQYVDQIPKAVKGSDRTVETLLKARLQSDNFDAICDVLGEMLAWRSDCPLANPGTELKQVLDRDIGLLSGGELQRFAIGIVCVQKADVLVLSPRAVG